jgi:transposase
MISPEKYMDVVSLHKLGLSNREIARKLGIDRRTVKKYLEKREFPEYKSEKRKKKKLEPYQEVINRFLEENNYKATWIWDRLKKMGYSGSYETVKQYVKTVKGEKARLAYIRFETEPGLQAQVDWGCFDVENPDGSIRKIYGFLMVLGYSRTLYVEFVESCNLQSLMDCHINAFHHLHGVTHEILYDNMKTVVNDRLEGKVEFNLEFFHFAHHYGFRPRVAPPYSPWVKGKIEKPVDFVRERFWRGYRFTTIEQANKDMKTWLNETANQRIHGTHHQQVSKRWQEEIPFLQTLPMKDYDTSLKVYRQVYKDCQISYKGNRYVVPHTMVGKKVLLKVKKGHIEFYNDHELLVSYEEPKKKGVVVKNDRFYQDLLNDRELARKKYGKCQAVGKGRAVAEPVCVPKIEVAVRSLSDYESFFGGYVWNN